MFKTIALLVVFIFFTLGCSKETRKEHYRNGTVKSSCEYNKEGKLDGTCKQYSPEGYLDQEEEYKNNVKHGKDIIYYPSGKVKDVRIYKDGKLDGPAKEYYENGELK